MDLRMAPAAPPTAPNDAAAAAVRELATAVQRWRVGVARLELGAGPVELSALEWLQGGPRTPTELAGWLQITTASVTGLIDRLADAGLVGRELHPSDRRKVLVLLTDEGRRRLNAVQGRLGDCVRTGVGDLDESSRTAVLAVLNAVAAEVLADSGPVPGATGPSLAEAMDRIAASGADFRRRPPGAAR